MTDPPGYPTKRMIGVQVDGQQGKRSKTTNGLTQRCSGFSEANVSKSMSFAMGCY